MTHVPTPPKKINLSGIQIPPSTSEENSDNQPSDNANEGAPVSTQPTECDPPIEPHPVIRPASPFHHHSLCGDGEKLLARAIDTKPLFGDFLMHGQASMVYAQPNAGKTLTLIRLIQDAIEEGRIHPDDVIYINADDSGKGLAEKVRLLEAIGVHMLAPGYKGFKANQVMDKLKEAVEDGTARGRVFVIDTVKKVANLMDKGRSSEFGQVCREAVMGGATIIGLGHTAKNPNQDGSPRYQGTTDILEDFDAVYVAEPMRSTLGAEERIIRFTQQKARADSPQVVGYAYSTAVGLNYEDKLSSLRPAYPEELDGSILEADMLDDEKVADLIRSLIHAGVGRAGQDKLVRAVAEDGDISRSQARRVLDRYTGTDPDRHRWSVQKGDRGKRTYTLLIKPKAESDD